jgi:hypothetical protein
MWMLVMFMMGGTVPEPQFSVYPKPLPSQEMCEDMRVRTEANLVQLKEKSNGKDVQTTLRCIEWAK